MGKVFLWYIFIHYTLFYFFLEKDIFHKSNIGIYRGTNLINQGWQNLCSVDFEIDNYVLF